MQHPPLTYKLHPLHPTQSKNPFTIYYIAATRGKNGKFRYRLELVITNPLGPVDKTYHSWTLLKSFRIVFPEVFTPALYKSGQFINPTKLMKRHLYASTDIRLPGRN